MWIIYDIVIIGLIALSTLIGYKQGLVKSAIKIVSFFIAIVIAFTLYKPVSALIMNSTPLDENIKESIALKITPDGVEGNQEVVIQNDFGQRIIGEATNTIEGISETFSIKIIETIILLLIYIIARIILRFVSALTDLIAKLPLLKQANELGGIIYGLLKGIILAYTILAIVYLASPILNKKVSEDIDKSTITKILYNNNIILDIIA